MGQPFNVVSELLLLGALEVQPREEQELTLLKEIKVHIAVEIRNRNGLLIFARLFKYEHMNYDYVEAKSNGLKKPTPCLVGFSPNSMSHAYRYSSFSYCFEMSCILLEPILNFIFFFWSMWLRSLMEYHNGRFNNYDDAMYCWSIRITYLIDDDWSDVFG